MVVTLIILAAAGLVLGSFVNALVWRVHEQSKPKTKRKDLSVLTGRSQCTSCGYKLATKDLVPLVSWAILKGRCRYCNKPISFQYPLIELVMAGVFIGSYLFWPSGGVDSAGDWVLLITWLASFVGLLALLVYDARWMLLPNRILYPTALVAVVGRLAYIIGFESSKAEAFLQWILAVAVASGIFWLLFYISKGRWIGFGDVRLGLITGTILANPLNSFLMIMLASVLGTLFVLPSLITRSKSVSSKLPYGPFLIAATAISLLFGGGIIDWYQRVLIP